MIWLAVVSKTKSVVIEGDHWHTVVHYLGKRFNVDPKSIETELVSENSLPEIEIRAVGEDFNHGGKPGGKRFEVRERESGDKPWGEWGPA